jgi:hypothetical protein
MPPGYIAPAPAAAASPEPTATTSTGGAAARKRMRLSEETASRKGKAPAVARSLDVGVTTETTEPVQALEIALSTLARGLQAATGSVPLNVAAVGELADAMGKTARALSDVRALMR